MDSPLAISTVLEEPMFPIGRRSYLLADPNRESRWMGVELWYPAQSGGGELALYEIIPGAGFTCQAQRDVEAVSGPLVPLFFSHGRSGNRLVYAQMCEALAARGFVIVSCDHPGDTMVEWMFGTALDDLSNERERAADVSFILDALANRSHGLDHPLHLDLNRLAMAGHSYGANTTVAFAGNSSSAIRPIAIAGVEPFLRTLSREVLGRVDVPVLLIGGRNDATTPPSTDMDYAVRHFSPDISVRCTVLENVGHQGCSDVGLYLEFASQIDGVPDAALAMLETMGAEVTGRAGEPWRPAVLAHVQLLGAWLSDLASAATNVEDFTQLERVRAHFTS